MIHFNFNFSQNYFFPYQDRGIHLSLSRTKEEQKEITGFIMLIKMMRHMFTKLMQVIIYDIF